VAEEEDPRPGRPEDARLPAEKRGPEAEPSAKRRSEPEARAGEAGPPAFEREEHAQEPSSPSAPFRPSFTATKPGQRQAEEILKSYACFGPADVLNMPHDPNLRWRPQDMSATGSFRSTGGFDKASSAARKVCKLTYHRVLSPPPVYRHFLEKTLDPIDADRKPWGDRDMDHFHPDLKGKRANRQRDTYFQAPLPFPRKARVAKKLGESSSTPVLPGQTLKAPATPPPPSPQQSPSAKLPRTPPRSGSTPALPGHSATIESVAATYRLPPMVASSGRGSNVKHLRKQPPGTGIEALQRLHAGELPQILCKPT
jgi:hypothetical protein